MAMRLPALMRPGPRGLLATLAAAGAGCGASIPQVSEAVPHGAVVLQVEHASHAYTYEDRIRVDGSEAAPVRSGDRLRLAPGPHALELESVARQYAVRDQVVTERVCDDPYCTYQRYRSGTRQALVLVRMQRCARDVQLQLVAGTETIVALEVGADLTCVARTRSR